MSFYGNITNTSRTQFQFDKIYPNRLTMDENCAKDGIYIGRYVLIEYDTPGLDSYKEIQIKDGKLYYNPEGEVDFSTLLTTNYAKSGDLVYEKIIDENKQEIYKFYMILDGSLEFNAVDYKEVIIENVAYTNNYYIDINKYGSGRGYDSTVWQKVFTNNEEKYVMIAELNTVVPTFNVVADPPTMNPVVPHFDPMSTNVYYKLHWQTPWGFRIAKARDGQPSDAKTTWINAEYDPLTGEIITSEDNEVSAAIYFNKNAFNPENANSQVEDKDNYIKITPGSGNNKIYYNHKNPSYKISANDIQEMTIHLPAIGNMMADAWDIIHGKDRKDSPDSLQGILNEFSNIAGGIPFKKDKDSPIEKLTIESDDHITTEIDNNRSALYISHKDALSDNCTSVGDIPVPIDEVTNNDINNQSIYEQTISVPYFCYDEKGHISSSGINSVTIPASVRGIAIGNTLYKTSFNHPYFSISGTDTIYVGAHTDSDNKVWLDIRHTQPYAWSGDASFGDSTENNEINTIIVPYFRRNSTGHIYNVGNKEITMNNFLVPGSYYNPNLQLTSFSISGGDSLTNALHKLEARLTALETKLTMNESVE